MENKTIEDMLETLKDLRYLESKNPIVTAEVFRDICRRIIKLEENQKK